MKFATTPEYDELLARGYPHLRRLIADHPHDADARTWADRALTEIDPITYFVDWPAEVARRWVRGFADLRISRGPCPGLDDGSPIDEAEGRRLLARMLEHEHDDGYRFRSEHGLLLIEAMIGSAATVDAVLTAFEAMDELEGEFSTRNHIAYEIGFVIRRLPAAGREQAEARIAALVARHPDSFTRDFLSYVVGGKQALIDSERKLGLYCLHFSDDPALIREVAAELVTSWDAQHFVLAGDALLDVLTPKALRQIWKYEKRWVIEQLGRLASPKAVAVLEEFGNTKSLAKYVESALAGRGKSVARKKKPAAKKPAAKKPAAKKPAAKKPAAKKPAAKKPAAKKKPTRRR